MNERAKCPFCKETAPERTHLSAVLYVTAEEISFGIRGASNHMDFKHADYVCYEYVRDNGSRKNNVIFDQRKVPSSA
jgi:hypothetical protein